MNRIILVGNGFDLAHGLKTSYCDFIEDYLNGVFNELVKEPYTYKDPLISIKKNNHFTKTHDFQIDLNSSLTEFFNDFKRRYSRDFFVSINTMLKSTLASISNCNWVDLEMAFFKTLCEGVKGSSINTVHVRHTNEALEFIKRKLEEYLSKIEDDISKLSVNPNILSILTEPPNIADFTATEKRSDNLNLIFESEENSHYYGKIERTMIVNFNYTSTLNEYYNQIPKPQRVKYFLNFIHGKLGDDQNPPIFGFGDEHDKKYLEFEDHNENSLFKHVKSFRYFNTGNYKDLIRFADSAHYQIFVVGHSCGLTDRTLLKSIFENENCRSIKIFHYRRPDGSTDYHEKTIEMGRHFSNKGFMRRVIVDFDKNDFLPQSIL